MAIFVEKSINNCAPGKFSSVLLKDKCQRVISQAIIGNKSYQIKIPDRAFQDRSIIHNNLLNPVKCLTQFNPSSYAINLSDGQRQFSSQLYEKERDKAMVGYMYPEKRLSFGWEVFAVG
ncbi:hypothetical protein CEXT_247111 [Caerostris extrusa]|uniref:Uncharacterized protein n=1 Tax=Caerostris extrusa TaxID=172846 RepID=A0AAV4XGV2_CAEEX|nr:hypothetical protein CEXT_247111 [Caerostris extrusa]